LAFVVSIVLTAVIGRRHFVLPFPALGCLQVLLASAAMGALLYPFRTQVSPLSLSAQITAGAIVYVLVLLGCNFLELRDQLLARWRAMRSVGVDAVHAGVVPAATLVE